MSNVCGRIVIMLGPEEVRLAFRRLCKHPGATLAAIAALAFGVGGAVASWSLYSAVLSKPLPVASPDRLFQVDRPAPDGITFAPGVVLGHSYPEVEAIGSSGVFDSVASGGPQDMLVTAPGGIPTRREVYFADDEFFATLGIRTALGRTFAAEENRTGAPPVVVVSDHYWRNVLNADPGALGRALSVSGTPATIIGVLPPGFRGLHLSESPDVYVPLGIAGDIDFGLFEAIDPLGPRLAWIRIVGRLRPGDTPVVTQSRLNNVPIDCPECEQTRGEVGPFFLTNVNTAALPFGLRADTTQFTTILSITVGLLLLAGCLTVGMLLLVRAEDRRDELALRLALGATRGRLASSIVAEATLLCFAGATLAIPVAFWLIIGVQTFQLPGSIDIARLELGLAFSPWLAVTATTLAFICVVSLLTSQVAVRAAGCSPLRSRALATPRVTRRTTRTVLVAGHVAITLVLVTGAGLFIRSLVAAFALNAGIETDRIFTATLSLDQYGYTEERAGVFVDSLTERLRLNSIVESVAIRQGIGSSQAGVPVMMDGASRELPAGLSYMAVSDTFFSTIGLPMVGGRMSDSVFRGESPSVIVSESLGRLIADGENAIGHRISDWTSQRRVLMRQGPPDYLEVVGVVPDLITSVRSTAPLVAYQPIPPDLAVGGRGTLLIVRAADDPDSAMREVIAAARALDPQVTLENMMTLDQQIGREMTPQRFAVYILGSLGGIALLLTVLGTYTITKSMVIRRRRELGIRTALGAGRANLGRLVLTDTARLVGIGIVCGLGVAALGARFIRSLLYQVQPLDPLVLAAASALMLGLALLVSLGPVLEATRLDITRSLREE